MDQNAQQEQQDVINMLASEANQNLNRARQAELAAVKLKRQLQDLQKELEELKKPKDAS